MMLRLNRICKDYRAGDSVVHALKDVTLSFRQSEFVAILGASGCGKTTLLNLVGGLDRYTSGDLCVCGRSTKGFSDKDWDSYRNHSIGFVFQSYNLIPHQTVLQNVELALTLSGVSKAERRKRAVDALTKVGLGDQIKKKPNQMSGGQMQRVAIARALVNDPEIILADEPTGALDSVTSVQIMDILKEISQEKLIIMVTHNPELAETYATRIVRLHDGQVEGDTAPFSEEDEAKEVAAVAQEREKEAVKQSRKARKAAGKTRTSMSVMTAFSLSLNNLLTKKTRTFLTSFAGSIGIIGIALILALSNGIDLYIDKVQEDALSTYPLTIESETFDMTALMNTMMGTQQKGDHDMEAIYANPVLKQMLKAMNKGIKQNNLTDFKVYLENHETLKDLVLDIQYDYDVELTVYASDTSEEVLRVNPSAMMEDMMGAMGMSGTQDMSSLATEMYQLNVWEEMLGNADLLKTQYDVIQGRMPETYNEIVLVVNEFNEISDMTLYTLGLLDDGELSDILQEFMDAALNGTAVKDDGEKEEWKRFDYADLLGLTYKVVLPTDLYRKEDNGTFTDMSKDEAWVKACVDSGLELKVVGILRPNADATATSIGGSVAYTEALTDYVMEQINQSDIVKAQVNNKTTDVFTGNLFRTEEEKAATMDDVVAYLESLPEELRGQYEVYLCMMGKRTVEEITPYLLAMSEEERGQCMTLLVLTGKVQDPQIQGYIDSLPAEDKAQMEMFADYMASMTDEGLLEMLGDDEGFAAYLTSIGKGKETATLQGNLRLLGHTSPDSPHTVSIYAKDFNSKEEIINIIDGYNEGKEEADRISYTDYIGIMLSSVSTIVNFVSYALIAFVSISLVVSSIMIGIITYISVLERTKEIGILRAIGASKKDISRVFNAETFIVGLVAGLIGVLTSVLLTLPINAIIYALGEVANIAKLPFLGAVILVLISVGLTLIAGLIPSRIAAKKDPVESLRSE